MGVILKDTSPMRTWAGNVYGVGSKSYTFNSAGEVEVSDAQHVKFFVEEHNLQPVSANGDDFIVIGLRAQKQDHELHQLFSNIDQYQYVLTRNGAVVMQRKPEQKEAKKR